MSASQQRQLRCWVSLWTKAGALFLVTVACLSVAATTHRQAATQRERALTALEEVIRQGQIKAWPIQASRVAASVEISAGIASTTSGGAAVNSAAASAASIVISTPNVGPPPSTPQLGLTLTRDGTGAKTLASPCAVGANYHLEVSLDLRIWARASSTTATGTTVAFGIAENPALGRVFYRLSGDAPPAPTVPPKGDPGPVFVSPTTGGWLPSTGPKSTVVVSEPGGNATL